MVTTSNVKPIKTKTKPERLTAWIPRGTALVHKATGETLATSIALKIKVPVEALLDYPGDEDGIPS